MAAGRSLNWFVAFAAVEPALDLASTLIAAVAVEAYLAAAVDPVCLAAVGLGPAVAEVASFVHASYYSRHKPKFSVF